MHGYQIMIRKILKMAGIIPSIKPNKEKPILNVEDYDPRWMWDIYGTGIRPPKRPVWLDGWQKEIVYMNASEVQLIAPLYDELEKYLDDMDKHMGKTRDLPHLPRYIAAWGCHGEIKVVRAELTEEH